MRVLLDTSITLLTADARVARYPGFDDRLPNPGRVQSPAVPKISRSTSRRYSKMRSTSGPHQQAVDEAPSPDRVADVVARQRPPVPLLETVLVDPEPVRAAPLLVHETERRLPRGDLAPPADRHAAQAQAVVDGGGRAHLDRPRRQHLEAEPRRGQLLEVPSSPRRTGTPRSGAGAASPRWSSRTYALFGPHCPRHARPSRPGSGGDGAQRASRGSGISGLSSVRARSNAGRGVSERTCSSQNTPS